MNPVASIRKALDALFRRNPSSPFKKQYESALALLNAGDYEPMQTLAKQSLGDAWFALATSYASSNRGLEDATMATPSFREAAQCRLWLDDLSNVARVEYTRRVFLGFGASPDYRKLAREWESHYFAGYQNETKLAWIYACGPEDLRSNETAWKWVALGEARWGQHREEDLPNTSAAKLRAMLERSVTNRRRNKLIEQAKRVAYREFVEGK